MKPSYIIFFILVISFIQKTFPLKCEEEEIENCLECGTGEASNRCAKCEDKYFPFLFNYLCLPCDHMSYGDSGCDGNCQYDQKKGLMCDEFGCKPGFYSIDRMTCMNCNSIGHEYCAKCTYLPPEGLRPNETDEREFECQECINEEFAVFPDGKCHNCYWRHNFCSKCHFIGNSTQSICDKCYYGYYLSNNNVCKKCFTYPIYGGYCRQCTDDNEDYDNIECFCNYTYTKKTSRTCASCPSGCRYCDYDQNERRVKCNYCAYGYVLNSQGYCTPCGKGCNYCILDSKENPICTYCSRGYNLREGKCYNCDTNCDRCHLENDNYICDICSYYSAMDSKKKCISCPSYCTSCSFDQKQKLICTSCYKDYSLKEFYALNSNSLCEKCPNECRDCSWIKSKNKFGCKDCYFDYAFKDDDCFKCSSISDLGEGCNTCSYDSVENKFKCHSCISRDYARITNIYKCLPNTNSDDPQLYGCLRATYNSETGKYECNICKPEFIPILNDKSCRLPSTAELNSLCREAINIGNEINPLYSCTSCKWSWVVNVTDYRGKSDCYENYGDLYLCVKAKKDEQGNINCTQCQPNFQMLYSETYNKNICDVHCVPGAFKKNYKCYTCDELFRGNPGCDQEKNCSYSSANDQLNCNECKVGYYKYTYGQCFQCKLGDLHCLECHMNESADKFECDKCIDGYFVNDNKKCEMIRCEEHPEVMPGCIICNNELTKYKEEGKCQGCKAEYFKTKDGECVHCKAKKNGGPACDLCEYEKNEEGEEKNNIICKSCPGYLTNEGKCYSCEEELENGCKNCTLKLNPLDNKEKFICVECKDNYLLSKNGHCIHFNSYTHKIPYCQYQYDYLQKFLIEDDINITSSDNTDLELDEEPKFNFNNTDYRLNNTNNTQNVSYRYEISSICEECKNGYINRDDTCIPFNIKNCSLNNLISLGSQKLNITYYKDNFYEKEFISNYFGEDYYKCTRTCQDSSYVKIDYYYFEITEPVIVYYETNDTIYEEEYDYYDNKTNNYNKTKNDSYINNTDILEEYNNKTDYKNDNKTNNYTEYDKDSTQIIDYTEYIDTNIDTIEEANVLTTITSQSIESDEYPTTAEKPSEKPNYNTENYEDYQTDNIINNRTQKKEIIEALELKTMKYNLSLSNLTFMAENMDKITINAQIIMNILSKSYMCLNNYGTGEEDSPESLRKCKRGYYLQNNNTYVCTECIKDYTLDEDTKTCKQSIKVSMNLRPGFSNCRVRNIGTYNNPVYSCYSCYNWNDLLVTSDTGAKFCESKKGELAGCTEVFAETNYLNNVYNCTFCDRGYISYYNIFFEKIICQNVHQEPDKKRELDSQAFNPDKVEHVPAINGECQNSKLFTPDGINCYACNNRTVGMVGCKGSCVFNLKRNISLKCEEGMCKTGYIEKTKGVCEPCETINEGCIECHYEDNYLSGYYGFKRKRRFSCDQCDNGYLISEDGTCHHCSTLGFDNCKNCGVDEKHDNEIICVECQPGFFVNKEGKCTICPYNYIKGKDNTCIKCEDVESGGIEGCQRCKNVNNEPRCLMCKSGFVLLKNNYTCLRISENVELEELPHCQIAKLNSNRHFDCAKCEDNFVLLLENEKIKCFSANFIPSINTDLCDLYENLGTEDKPKYSCSICRSNEDEEEDYWKEESLTRITYKNNETAFCEYPDKYSALENSTEATMIIDSNNNDIKLNCTECIENNTLYYHKDTDLNICKYKYIERQCVIKYCKRCVKGNNYFCEECLPENYEVSSLTGACVRKAEKNPAVYFKDIFRFKLNQYKQIGGRMLYGPFFSLRGLTNSQINTGHAFLVSLAFKLHYTRNNRNRNLEENRDVKAYCQIVESADETDGEPNIVDFDCIGDTEEEESFEDYDLDQIKENTDNNKGIFEQSNLNDLAKKMDLADLKNKNETTFELQNFFDLIIFNPDEVNNIISKDYHFDLTLNGKINRELNEESIDVQIPLNIEENKTVGCKFNIKADKNADLKCDLNLEAYKDTYKVFALKVTEVSNSENKPIYLSRINEAKLIHEEEKEKSYVVLIVLVVVAVVVVGLVTGLVIFFYKRKNGNKMNSKDILENKSNNPQIEYMDSKNKVI